MAYRSLSVGVLIALLALTGVARADVSQERMDQAKARIESMTDNALSALSEPKAERRDAFEGILDEYFDTRRIAMFLAGRHLRRASDEEKSQYFSAFENFVVNFYLTQLEPYSDGEVRVRGARLIGDEDVLVNSIAEVEGEEPVEANWRLRSDNGELLIVDVIVEGVSLAVSQRSQFDSVIQDQGFSGLVERLQDAAKGDGEADSLISDGPFTTTDGESG